MNPTYEETLILWIEQLRDVYCGRRSYEGGVRAYEDTETWIANLDAIMGPLCELAGLDFEPQEEE